MVSLALISAAGGFCSAFLSSRGGVCFVRCDGTGVCDAATPTDSRISVESKRVMSARDAEFNIEHALYRCWVGAQVGCAPFGLARMRLAAASPALGPCGCGAGACGQRAIAALASFF